MEDMRKQMLQRIRRCLKCNTQHILPQNNPQPLTMTGGHDKHRHQVQAPVFIQVPRAWGPDNLTRSAIV